MGGCEDISFLTRLAKVCNLVLFQTVKKGKGEARGVGVGFCWTGGKFPPTKTKNLFEGTVCGLEGKG